MNVEVYDNGDDAITTNGFWTCACSDESPTYVHNAYEESCPHCGAEQEASPNAWVIEVLTWPFCENLDENLLAAMQAARPRKTMYVANVRLLIEADNPMLAETEVSRILTSQLQGNTAGVSHLLDWDAGDFEPQEIVLPYLTEEGLLNSR